MWEYARNMVVRQLFWASVLSFVLRSKHRQKAVMLRWIDSVAKLAQLLPAQAACEEVCRAFWVIPAYVIAPLTRRVAHLCVQDKRNLLLLAQTLPFYGEYEEAQILLWRGIRLYETDRDVWECALRVSLERLLFSVSYSDWEQSFHRYNYLVAQIPSDIKSDPTITPYLMFSAEEEKGEYLSATPPLCVWLWQSEEISGARERMNQWWSLLRERSDIPEPAARIALWYMLGLGMFEEIVSDKTLKQLSPKDVLLAGWFNGSALPPSCRGSEGNYLTWFAFWCEYLMESRRPPIAVVWRSWMAARRESELFLNYVLLAATYGLHRRARHERFFSSFERSRARWFLPYLHFLCVATARLLWEPETREIWRRIQCFQVDYARKEDLRQFLLRCFPQADWVQ